MLRRYYLTCAGKSDGGGAQVHAVCSALAFAHHHGMTYVHTPFNHIGHAGKMGTTLAAQWERAFALGLGERQINEPAFAKMRRHPLTRGFQLGKLSLKPTLLVAEHCHWFTNSHPQAYEAIRPRLIEKYRGTRHATPARDHLTVAVHVRRGDVNPIDWPHRFTRDEVILHQVQQISAALGNRAHEIHLYSEGEPAQFEIFRARANAILHLSEDVFDSIDAMIDADVLVMAKSSFSYVAALLSDAIKIYSPFQHPPLRDWIVSDAEGSFGADGLGRAISNISRSTK